MSPAANAKPERDEPADAADAPNTSTSIATAKQAATRRGGDGIRDTTAPVWGDRQHRAVRGACTTSASCDWFARALKSCASFGVLHIGERVAQPTQPGADPRLRGTERDVLSFRDLASAQSPDPGH